MLFGKIKLCSFTFSILSLNLTLQNGNGSGEVIIYYLSEQQRLFCAKGGVSRGGLCLYHAVGRTVCCMVSQ